MTLGRVSLLPADANEGEGGLLLFRDIGGHPMGQEVQAVIADVKVLMVT